MSTGAAAIHAPPAEREVFGVTNGKLAMWLFLGSDGMSFMGLIAAYVTLRYGNREIWPDPTKILGIYLTALNTFVLICSSLTMVKAFLAAKDGDVGGLKLWLGCTILGGATFLGIQAYEYNHLIHEGIKLWDSSGSATWEFGEAISPWMANKSNLFMATFFVCTCFHGFHVLSGVIYLSAILVGVLRGRWTVNRIELVGLYWHFVDLVWIIIFTIIYLF